METIGSTTVKAIERRDDGRCLYRLSDGREVVGDEWPGIREGDRARVEGGNGTGLRLCFGPHFGSSFIVCEPTDGRSR